MKKLELTLGAPAAGGGFVARDEGGRVIFVRHGLPGERVIAQLTEEHPRWARADAIEILTASPDRVEAPCAYAGPGACGGCDYQHIALDAQRSLKTELLGEQLRRIAGIDLLVTVEPAAPGEPGLGTRTRVRFGVDESGHLGMRRARSDEVIPVTTCLLAVPAIQALQIGAQAWPRGCDVQVVSLGIDPTPSVTLVPTAKRRSKPEIPDTAANPPSFHEVVVDGLEFRVSPSSFWQIHRRGPERLTQAVLEMLDPSPGDQVIDLYCGVGLFTKAIARAVGSSGQVIGVDSSARSVEDARFNLSSMPWTQVVESAVTAAAISDHLGELCSAVLDPPRSGCERSALEALSRSSTLRTIVSVSCDPATFARDTKLLLEQGWSLQKLRALDLFEMTEHFECVAHFRR